MAFSRVRFTRFPLVLSSSYLRQCLSGRSISHQEPKLVGSRAAGCLKVFRWRFLPMGTPVWSPMVRAVWGCSRVPEAAVGAS